MIKLFRATDKAYTSNGDIVLETTRAKVHKEDNGDFYINVEAPILESKLTDAKQEAGSTASGKNFTIQNVDKLKSDELIQLDGDTTQETTTGKNLLPNDNTTQTISGITFTKNSDGSIKINGTATAQVAYRIDTQAFTLTSGTYTLSTKNNLTANVYFQAWHSSATNFILINPNNNSKTATISSDVSNVRCQIVISNGATVNNLTIYPMLEKSSSATEYEPYTNGASPNPTYPQPINVVSGRQDIVVAGKNLFDKTKVINSRYVNSANGQLAVGTATYNASDFIRVDTGDYIWGRVSATGYHLATYDINQNFIRAIGRIDTAPLKITMTNQEKYVRFTVLTNDLDTMQFEKGSTATTYEAYKGNTYEINLGKNLYYMNYADYTYNDFSGTDITSTHTGYSISGTSTSNTAFTLTNRYITLPAGTYTVSLKETSSMTIRLSKTNYSVITAISIGSKSATFTLTEETNVCLTLVITNGTQYNETNEVMIEKGSTASSFSEYKTPIELCKIPNTNYQDHIFKAKDGDSVYDNLSQETKDTLTYGSWYIEKQIGKVVLDGTETWNKNNDNRYYLSQYGRYFKYNGSTDEYVLMSDIAIKPTNSSSTSEYKIYNNWNGNIFINHLNIASEYTTSQWATAMAGHYIYGVLTTPTYTEITDSELLTQINSIKLIDGLNNVSVASSNLSGDITIHYNFLNVPESSLKYIEYLVPNNIIVANTPQGDQAFRITNVENTRTKIKIKAYHVFYDSENYLIQDSYVVDKNCNDALDHLNSSTDNPSPFTTISDITKIASYRCVRKSLYEAIQVLLERYGGHLYRDNWTIGIKANLGQDNGVTIRYGKNLKNIKATYNWDNVCTKLLPVGKDGLLLNALDPSASVYLEAFNQYDIPYTKSVSFDQNDIVEDDYKDAETGQVDEQAYKQALIDDLTEQGQSYLQVNSIPVVNYTLSANVEKVSDIGDTIQVVDEKLGINLLTNIISYEYDCILDKYTEIEFGNFTPTLSGLMGSINNQIQQTVDESTATLQITLGQELEEATDKIWNALGNSYVIYDGDKILVVDSLPKETATNVIMINNGGIGFSNNGINGTFNSAWTIDNVLNMEQINVINLTADLIKGGTLKLGSNLNQNGQIEVYDEANSLIAQLNKNGLKMYGVDGSYILMNNTVGFSGYDRLGNQIYWVSKDEFHMKKSVVEEEITLCNKLRFIPITITDSNNQVVNDGIGLVSVAGGGN